MADQPGPSMACSLCAPHKSRADGAMVAHELDQLMSAVLEGSTKAMVAIKFLGFFRQHPIHGPGTSAPAFEKFRKICRRQPPERIGVVPTQERPRNAQTSQLLALLPATWHLLAIGDAESSPLRHTHMTRSSLPPLSRSNNTKADHGGSSDLTNALW
jgi:hypothetical protein